MLSAGWVELWDIVGRGRATRYVPVTASIEYLRGLSGERYLGPQGRGRMTPKMVRDSLASRVMSGQSPAVVRKQAKQCARHQP
jgi:hypothetical protein